MLRQPNFSITSENSDYSVYNTPEWAIYPLVGGCIRTCIGSSMKLHSIQPRGKSTHLFVAAMLATNLSSLTRASKNPLMRLSIQISGLDCIRRPWWAFFFFLDHVLGMGI